MKYPFWKMTHDDNPNAAYICINLSEAYIPAEIKKRSICIDNDMGETLKMLKM